MNIGNLLKIFKVFNKTYPEKNTATITAKMHYPSVEGLEKQCADRDIINKKLRENSIPDSSGLYPHEVLMLSFAEKYVVGECKFQSFWKHKYAIDDPGQLLVYLQSCGFLCISPVKNKLDCLSTSQLKEVLRGAGLKLSGNKQEIIQRILDNISEQELANSIKQRYYTVTEKGKNEIANNEYVLYMHNYPFTNITVWSMNRLMQGYPPKLYRDKIWSELNRLDLEQDNILSNAIKYQKIEFLFEENRLSEALPILALVLHNSLNYIIPERYVKRFELYAFYGREHQMLKPEPIGKLVEMECGTAFRDIHRCYIGLSNKDTPLADFISVVLVGADCQDALFSKSELIKLVVAKISGDEDTFNVICGKKEKILEKGGYHVKA